MERIADGVWLLRGDARNSMNIYFLEDDGNLVQFDAGTKRMAKHAKEAAQQLGELTKIVLGHAHSDHRGTAPSMGVPVFCHPDEVEEAEGPGPLASYWDLSQLPFAPTRLIYPTLHRRWDGGPVKVAGTVSEGDEVAGFRVIHFPGHAPGLIGLWRESDRLALVSDVIYLFDTVRWLGRPLPAGEASVPHPVWSWDHAKSKESVRKLAALEPATVCTGHVGPLRGDDLRETLERAAEKF